ncbi:hypothetical protein BKA65DRAFT_475025 [Rhexocercosporidium sp. MPI-PUGE-AT-0058]|nr:hypothetical protein BKA65DRAFT_475025 [Rhexocercosporidium sp. MPI-PUGE-AT-0058]
MEQPARPPVRKNRSSGKHSRTGCGTCKIRRVKCDEGKPICNRCLKFGIACDGYNRQSRTPSPRAGSQKPAVALRTRTSSLPSISYATITSIFGSDEEMLYFSTFRDQTSFQVTPFFDSDSFRVFILQACSVPSIRLAVIAIGALAKSCITFQEQRSSKPGQYKVDCRTHHRAAIKEYSKALGLMREASSQGRQGLRTTLITTLLIACFEGAHGNYTLADAQIESGLALIESWQRSHTSTIYRSSSFSSPAPDVIDDILIRIFGGLEIQSGAFGVKNTVEQHRLMMYDGEETLQGMPVCFESLEPARAYLEIMIRRLLHWMYSVDVSHNTETEDKVQGCNNIQGDICLDATLLRLGFKSCVLLLNTVGGQTDISLESDRVNMADIVYLAKAVLDGLRARSNSYFTILQGAIDPARLAGLFENPTQQSRIEAIGMLFRWPRWEGISDSLFLGQTMRWDQTTEPTEPGSSNNTPPIREDGTGENSGEYMQPMEIGHQSLLTPDGSGNRERRWTFV